MNDPDTIRAMVGAVDAPKRENPNASPKFASQLDELVRRLHGCRRQLHAIVDGNADEIAALPPRAEGARRRDGRAIWRERAFQLRALIDYYENLSRSQYNAAAIVSMDRRESG